MTVDQYIALFSSIGACLSAIGAFLAVKQNTKQMQSSYAPALVITTESIYGEKSKIFPFPASWRKISIGEHKDTNEMPLLSDISLQVKNIGLGAAKQVAFEWSFPFQSVISEINNIAQKNLKPAYFEFINEKLKFKSEESSQFISSWENQKNEYSDYVLPVSIEKNGFSLKIPHSYVMVTSALIYFSALNIKESSFPELPKLKLNIKYHDIGGALHEINFEMEMTITMIMGTDVFNGQLSCKKSA